MPVGAQIDGISFTGVALVDRPEHAAVLGRIFTSWSLIEATVASLLGLMMHADDRAVVAILGTFRTNSSRVDAVRKVGKAMLDPPDQADFDDLMKQVLAYAEERNAIAHSLWGVHQDEPDVVYRMPMTAISNFIVKSPFAAKLDAVALVASFKSQMTSFTVADLEKIEQQGREAFTRVMKATTGTSFAKVAKAANAE